MGPIRLIRNTADLSGTCYFEFLPGEYHGMCWNKQSVFLAEDVFGLFEPIIARLEPQFDHYAFVSIQRPTWEPIIAELDRLSASPGSGAVDRHVAGLAAELAAWLREQLTRFDCVSVLGM